MVGAGVRVRVIRFTSLGFVRRGCSALRPYGGRVRKFPPAMRPQISPSAPPFPRYCPKYFRMLTGRSVSSPVSSRQWLFSSMLFRPGRGGLRYGAWATPPRKSPDGRTRSLRPGIFRNGWVLIGRPGALRSAKSPSRNLNFPLSHLLAPPLGYEGESFVKDLACVMPIGGVIPMGPVLPARAREASLSAGDWSAGSHSRNKRTAGIAYADQCAGPAQAFWRRNHLEVSEAGLMGQNRFGGRFYAAMRPLPRYAFWESHGGRLPKVR